MSGCRWPTLCSRERRVERSKEERATVRWHLGVISECISSRHGEGQVTATSIPRMTLGSCLSRRYNRRGLRWCVCVCSRTQVHGQVWSSCQTERLGVLGAEDARTSVDRDAVLLPRSTSRLAPPAGPAPRAVTVIVKQFNHNI
jgi:hypothetical protein